MSERTIEAVKKRNIPELLAPVGGQAQLEAAVYNGADAVYMGGALFNARMKADNFSRDEMKKAIDFAHEYGVKVYITLNTLIKDSEMAKAFSYACALYEDGADAVILQDLGLADLIHRYIPGLPMHLSTQGTVYNRSGLEMAADLGFSRVVPARELSLDEIRTLCQRNNDKTTDSIEHARNTEVEVFVHGALCMCYSGQCQMSRLLGGGSARSGNRGLCAQPCRLQYTDDMGKQYYALSPKDICTLDDIQALCESGVDSFKIEGRLKSSEYVATVTRIYRKYLDMYAETGRVAVEERHRKDLLQIFNRGGFAPGYLHGNPEDEILSGNSPKNQGVRLGKIVAVRDVEGRGGQQGRKLIDVMLEKSDITGTYERVTAGDGVETVGAGNVVTYVKELGKHTVRIGDLRPEKGRTLRCGDIVYKVTDAELNASAMNPEADLRTKIHMTFVGNVGETALLTAVVDSRVFEISGEMPIEAAIKRPADPERIKEQLGKLGGTPFRAGKISVNVDKDAMIPVSLVNEMRRQLVDAVCLARKCTGRTAISNECISEALKEIEENISEVHSTTENRGDNGQKMADIKLIPLELFMKGKRENNYVPYILNVSKGNLDKYIESNFDEIVDSVRDCGIALGNLGWIREFIAEGVRVYGDYGLNVYNCQAEKLFRKIGVDVISWSDEMSDDGRHFTGKTCSGSVSAVSNATVSTATVSRIPAEMNNIPLMITEHPLRTDYLSDRKGVNHKVIKWYSGDKYLIF